MTDRYPPTLEIEIDRPRLKTYLRVKWLLSWLLILGLFGGLFGLLGISKTMEQGQLSWREIVIRAATGVAIAFATTLLLAALLYFICSHRLAARFANELQVTVEGPFLRIRQRVVAMSDRKLHFRAIVDYAVTQDPLMRYFAINALQMTTTGSGQTSTITIPGVKDCRNARDLLSEIDRLRENSP